MENKAEKFQQICETMAATYAAKNHDYGDSFSSTFAEFGIVAAITRMTDKMNRIKALSKSVAEVKSESLKDTLIDLANYSIMTILELEETAPMTMNDYQDLAMFYAENTAGIEALREACYGLTGEAGETIEVLKKHEFQGHEFDRNKFIEELGDALWYIAQAATAVNVTMEDLATRNLGKISDRYPSGFDPERSVNRND